MKKRVLLGLEARDKVFQGAEKLYNAVRVTLGPKGRNFMIGKPYTDPELTHDGITVANAVQLSDPAEEAGAAFIRSAAAKNNTSVGDGTTTTTILTYSLLKHFDIMENPMQFAKDLQVEAEKLCAQLKPQKVEDLAQVATISCADETMGALVAKAVEAVGVEGSVLVEASQALETELEMVEGFKIDKGYVSPYMATDETGRAVYEDVPILVCNMQLRNWPQLAEVLQTIQEKQIVIIADDFSREVVAQLVTLSLRGTFSALLIKSPGYGFVRDDTLEDICAITGATLVTDEISINNLGRLRKIVSDQDESILTGTPNDVHTRTVEITLTTAATERDKTRAQNRLANLKGKIAVIRVGGTTETEVKEKVYRIDDAIAASRAALEEGIVPGGATAYLSLKPSDTLAGETFARALKEPFIQLMSNAGLSHEALPNVDEGYGYDVNNPEKPVKMVEAGIVDPAKVVKEAIRTSASIAGAVLTMGGLVVQEEEKDETKS